MGDKAKLRASNGRRGGRILRFAISGSLLVSAPLMAGCSDDKEDKDEPTVNEPAEETVNEPPDETVNEPPPEEELTANEPAPDEGEEPAADDEADTAGE